MRTFSKTNKVRQSNGQTLSRATAEGKIRKAKREVLNEQKEAFGYNYCEDCGINDRAGIPLDCSHDVSVAHCFDTGRAELAWSRLNISVRCRDCHRKHDKM